MNDGNDGPPQGCAVYAEAKHLWFMIQEPRWANGLKDGENALIAGQNGLLWKSIFDKLEVEETKKTNPRKIPVTMADIGRAKREAQNRAIEAAWSIMFTVLRDKEGYSTEDLQRVWHGVNELSDSIAKGYCKISDLKDVLKKEAGARLV